MELHLEDIYRKKSVPSEKPNMRYQMQMSRVKEGAPGNWLEFEKRCRANIHLNISWFELKSRVTSDFGRPGLSGGLRPVPKEKISLLQNFVQINGPQWICIRPHNGPTHLLKTFGEFRYLSRYGMAIV
jgi:hypothetical protein